MYSQGSISPAGSVEAVVAVQVDRHGGEGGGPAATAAAVGGPSAAAGRGIRLHHEGVVAGA